MAPIWPLRTIRHRWGRVWVWWVFGAGRAAVSKLFCGSPNRWLLDVAKGSSSTFSADGLVRGSFKLLIFFKSIDELSASFNGNTTDAIDKTATDTITTDTTATDTITTNTIATVSITNTITIKVVVRRHVTLYSRAEEQILETYCHLAAVSDRLSPRPWSYPSLTSAVVAKHLPAVRSLTPTSAIESIANPLAISR